MPQVMTDEDIVRRLVDVSAFDERIERIKLLLSMERSG